MMNVDDEFDAKSHVHVYLGTYYADRSVLYDNAYAALQHLSRTAGRRSVAPPPQSLWSIERHCLSP